MKSFDTPSQVLLYPSEKTDLTFHVGFFGRIRFIVHYTPSVGL